MRINKIQQNTPNFQKISFSDKTQSLIKNTIRENLSTCNEAKADYINSWKYKIENICHSTINMFAIGEKSYKDFNNECLRSYKKPAGVFEDLDIVVEDIKGIEENPANCKNATISYFLPQLNYKSESEIKFLTFPKLSRVLDMIDNSLPTYIKTVLVEKSPLKRTNKQNQLPQKELDVMIDNLFK